MLEADSKAGAGRKEKIDYKADIARTFAEVNRLDEETQNSLAETERLRGETREILDRLKAVYNVALDRECFEGTASSA